jgi:hypothetical protein
MKDDKLDELLLELHSTGSIADDRRGERMVADLLRCSVLSEDSDKRRIHFLSLLAKRYLLDTCLRHRSPTNPQNVFELVKVAISKLSASQLKQAAIMNRM